MARPEGFSMRGIVNILIGGVFIVGGLSGKMVMRGTGSGMALAAIGGVLVLVGLYRLSRTSG
jgi:hypothetical protein